jgi:pSer/pThr/pTyr-binding forkhead associated (FHA) protein
VASPHLRKLTPGTQEQYYVLQKAETILGRNPACDIVVPIFGVSRHQARIVRIGDRFYVEDMGSRDGTRVIRSGVTKQIMGQVQLRDEDDIWIGSIVVAQFRD